MWCGRVATQERPRGGGKGRRAVAEASQESGAAAERRHDHALRFRAAGRRGKRFRDPGTDRDRETCVSREEKEQGRSQGEAVDAAADQERLLRRAPRGELHRARDAVFIAIRAESSAHR